MHDLHLPDSNAGLLLLVYLITGLFLSLPAGLTYQKAGVRVTGILAGGLILLGATLGAVHQNIVVLLVSLIVGGCGASFMAVLAPAIIAQWFAARQRGMALGIWAACMTIGSAAILPAVPALAKAADWRSALWLGAGYALVVTVLYVAFVKPAPAAGSAAKSGAAAAPSVTPALVLRNRNIWLLAAAFAGFIAAASSLEAYLWVFLVAEHGLAQADVARLSSVTMLITVFSAPAGGALSDRIGSRKKPYLVGLAAMVVLLPLVGVLGMNWLIALGVSWLIVLVSGAVLPTIFAAAVESAGDERLGGVAMAVIMVGRYAGLLLGPLVFGALLSVSGWPVAFAGLAVMSALGLLAGWLAKVR
jgi:nitrate/nitrite transporter NarK